MMLMMALNYLQCYGYREADQSWMELYVTFPAQNNFESDLHKNRVKKQTWNTIKNRNHDIKAEKEKLERKT